MDDRKNFIFYSTAFLAAVFLFVMLTNARPANAQHENLTRAAHKHCICLSHGPRGGCLRWQCRRQYERERQ